MKIGEKITADSDDYSATVEGTITGGYGLAGEFTRKAGEEVDPEGTVYVREIDGDELRLNGWLWRFEDEAARVQRDWCVVEA